MATAANLPIAADRVGACVRTLIFRGIDLTGIALAMQIRIRPDTPGAPLIDLTLQTVANAQGLRLESVETVAGLPISTVVLRINESTMKDPTKVPYFGEPGSSSVMSYDLIGTFSGDKRRLVSGAFVALPTTFGSDDATPGSAGGSGGAYAAWSSATLTFGEETVSVTIDGADLLQPLIAAAQGYRDQTETAAGRAEAAAAIATTASAGATTAVSAAVVPINDYLTVLAKRFEGYGPGSFVAGQADFIRTARNNLTRYYVDTRTGGDASFDGTAPYKPKANGDATYVANRLNSISLLFKNGQQHMFRAQASTNSCVFGGIDLYPTPMCLGNFGAGATAPPLIDTRHIITETWVNVAGDVWETTIPIEAGTVFGQAGAAPNVATPRPTVWLKPDTDSNSIGTVLPWVTSGATAAANNTALAALSGVGVTVRAPNGSGFETAGEIRSTGATLSSVVVRIKRPAGVNPNSERLLIVDRGGSVRFNGGWHGSFTLVPGMGKDSAAFSGMNLTYGGPSREIPWGEEVTVYGGGHGGVGPFNTVGKFSGIGVPAEGEPTFSLGQTGGYAVHRFDPGIDYRDQYLYNQSVYAANAQVSLGMHGAGVAGEGYRGWIIPDDLTIFNCSNGISPALIVEGFYHYGRLDIQGAPQVLNIFDTPFVKLAGKGGQFVAAIGQAALINFNPVDGHVVDVGSDNLGEPFWLDGTAVRANTPYFESCTLVTSGDFSATPGAPIHIILRNVRDRLGKAGAAANKSFRLDNGGYLLNSNNCWLDLRAGTQLQNALLSNVADLTTIPRGIPKQLSWASGVQWGIGNHTFAEIEAAYAALGRTCSIASGAIAVNVTGDIIDVKA